jgi:acyl-CoA reductase-like NAD-dependent aldehyde dehydrogenase
MELGGMDPFLVLRDAKVPLAVELAIKSRASNCGIIIILTYF